MDPYSGFDCLRYSKKEKDIKYNLCDLSGKDKEKDIPFYYHSLFFLSSAEEINSRDHINHFRISCYSFAQYNNALQQNSNNGWYFWYIYIQIYV